MRTTLCHWTMKMTKSSSSHSYPSNIWRGHFNKSSSHCSKGGVCNYSVESWVHPCKLVGYEAYISHCFSLACHNGLGWTSTYIHTWRGWRPCGWHLKDHPSLWEAPPPRNPIFTACRVLFMFSFNDIFPLALFVPQPK